jgi:hypothetical protein
VSQESATYFQNDGTSKTLLFQGITNFLPRMPLFLSFIEQKQKRKILLKRKPYFYKTFFIKEFIFAGKNGINIKIVILAMLFLSHKKTSLLAGN